ncbi:universal stress protein [Micromonospora rhizosphaerae]|uniref:universal stress protein n=1 Tax=Micromonospora rhizosphaerae TaxID=568872 RepID=UPI003CCB8536
MPPGRTLGRRLLGSVGHAVLHHAPGPVAVVRRGSDRASPPGAAMSAAPPAGAASSLALSGSAAPGPRGTAHRRRCSRHGVRANEQRWRRTHRQ